MHKFVQIGFLSLNYWLAVRMIIILHEQGYKSLFIFLVTALSIERLLILCKMIGFYIITRNGTLFYGFPFFIDT